MATGGGGEVMEADSHLLLVANDLVMQLEKKIEEEPTDVLAFVAELPPLTLPIPPPRLIHIRPQAGGGGGLEIQHISERKIESPWRHRAFFPKSMKIDDDESVLNVFSMVASTMCIAQHPSQNQRTALVFTEKDFRNKYIDQPDDAPFIRDIERLIHYRKESGILDVYILSPNCDGAVDVKTIRYVLEPHFITKVIGGIFASGHVSVEEMKDLFRHVFIDCGTDDVNFSHIHWIKDESRIVNIGKEHGSTIARLAFLTVRVAAEFTLYEGNGDLREYLKMYTSPLLTSDGQADLNRWFTAMVVVGNPLFAWSRIHPNHPTELPYSVAQPTPRRMIALYDCMFGESSELEWLTKRFDVLNEKLKGGTKVTKPQKRVHLEDALYDSFAQWVQEQKKEDF